MILLDAYALIAFLADEPSAPEVEALIREGEAAVLVVNLAESLDVTQRVHGVAEAELRSLLDPLLDEFVAVVVQPEDAAWRAARLRLKYYDRRLRPLSLADCLLLAACDTADVATADPLLAAAVRAEGGTVVALPNSTGTRP